MSHQEEDDNLYGTTDFYTTAVLIAKKFKVVKITREGHKNGVKRFFFEATEELEKTVMSYMNCDLEGNLRDFRNAIETVKDMVHSG